MIGSEPVCQCERDDRPLCGYCLDDLFCPQCGDPITTAYSEELVRQNDRDVLFVYPDAESGEFLVTFASRCRDRDRRERLGDARLDLEQSWIEVADWFERRLEEFGSRDERRTQRYRLRPRGHLTGANWQVGLPEFGLRAALHAEGAFKRQTFDLCICRPPELLFSLEGDGVLPADDPRQRTWRLGERAQVAVRLTVDATAPIAFRDDLRFDAESFAVRPGNMPTRDRILTPGEPLSVDLTIDSRQWETNSDYKLGIHMLLASLGAREEELVLRSVAMGKLKFSCGPRLLLENLHLGDFVASAEVDSASQCLLVENVGQDNVFVSPPEVHFDSPQSPPAPWLAVTWDDAPDEMEERLIMPGESLPLRWQVDLRDLRAEHLAVDDAGAPSGDLSARIVLRTEQREWKLQVDVPGVAKRPPLDHWLAIDFGSTNTYVAAWHQDPAGGLPQIRPVMIGADPERFPSALFFDDLSCDPPKYTIGPVAAAKGEQYPTALATGMKRWIGVAANRDGKRQLWHLHDPRDGRKQLDAATLIRLYLTEVIRQSDRVLRREVRRVGVSFPANFEPSRVTALRAILSDVRAAFLQADPPRDIEFAEPRLDEATSVALGFVLDPEVLLPIIQPILTDSRPYVVIGSFDFGGGTIDTAAIKFELKGGNLRFARYVSRYLGVGGDENFGGETVTQAFLELLHDRLGELLREVAAANNQPLLRLPMARAGTLVANDVARRNHDALWAAAEQIKIVACSGAPPLTNYAEGTGTASSGTPLASPMPRELREHLVQQLNRLKGVPELGDEVQLMSDSKIRAALDAALDDGRLLISLDAVYGHALRNDLRVASRGTIRERLQACVTELFEFAKRHQETLDFVVLAGAACRLPLVRQLIEDQLSQRSSGSDNVSTRIHFDSDRPKSKVAQGLERYLVLRELAATRVNGLASPGDFAPWPLGIVEPATQEFLEIIPACTACRESDRWHTFPAPLVDVWSDENSRRVELHIKRRERAEHWGRFDLSQPGRVTEQSSAEASSGGATNCILPQDLSREALAEIRYCGGFEQIELRVRDGERLFGPWLLEARAAGASRE